MTRDEIGAESFTRMVSALNEVFPGIKSRMNGNFLDFNDDDIRVEMTTCDNFDGCFDVIGDDGSHGTLWGVKPVVNVLVREICNVRKQKILNKLV
jgi:hypothetical protein